MKNNEAGGYDSNLAFSSFWTDPDGFTMSAWIMPEFVFADEHTSPMAASNYKVAIDCGTGAEITWTLNNPAAHGCWKNVSRGMPQDNVYLKRQ